MSKNLVVVTFVFKILSGPFLRDCKVKKVDSWMGHWLGSASMLSHGVMFNLGSPKEGSPAIIETEFSYDKDTWIAVTDYYMNFYLIVPFLLVAILELINFTVL